MIKKFDEENFYGVVHKRLGVYDLRVILNVQLDSVYYLSQFVLVSALNINQLLFRNEGVLTNKLRTPLKIFLGEGQDIYNAINEICVRDEKCSRFKPVSLIGCTVLRLCDQLMQYINEISLKNPENQNLKEIYDK